MARRPFITTAVVTTLAALAIAGCGGDASDSGTASHPEPPAVEAPDGTGDTSTGADNRSTFGIDIDTASYGYARRQILDGRLPDPGMVRPEEFVNAFEQDYPEPAGDGFAVRMDGSRLPAVHEAAGDLRILRVGLQTRGQDEATRPDATLTFVVDVSGSMAEPGRLDLVKDALHTLVQRLRPSDAVAIVAFSDDARIVREMTRVADAEALHDAIDKLATEATTNLDAGLRLGYRVARDGFRPETSNRVVVLSDGLANTGRTDADEILERVQEEAAKQIALLGVGVGSEYGDQLMERLADRGDGFVVYVSEMEQARDVFVRRLPATLAVRALDAKVQVIFAPDAVASYRLIGYENRAVADDRFRDDTVDGGEVGPGHSVTALYAVRLAEGASADAEAARLDVRWLDPTHREPSEASTVVRVSDLDGAFETAAPRLWVDYTAAYLAEGLRAGAGEVALTDLAPIANRAADRTEDPAVRELADLVDRAARLR